MTPEELDLIAADGALVRADAGSFAARFYDTLFEIAPSTRRLFPDDLVAQRGKLVDELSFLVEAATASNTEHDLASFIDRAHDLGSRHVDYGVSGADYAPVGVALVAALRTIVVDWDAAHELAWTKLFRLISDVMREGAESVPTR
jgi:hemoglobin-like flavoprotein